MGAIGQPLKRLEDRPLVTGRIGLTAGIAFATALGLAGFVILWFLVNPLTALLGVMAFISYVLCYTPLKQRTTAALLIGAVPGAMPPLMGWTAATGSLGAGFRSSTSMV